MTRDVDVVVVGAGFAGLYALHRLRGDGLTVRVFEAADGVGGVWYWNRYPGARCDVESVDYSYSFDEQLQQDWDWSEKYATQPEILRYLNHVADRFNLRPDITFGARVTDAVLDEGALRWEIHTDTGEVVSARFLVLAVGPLSNANIPAIDGLGVVRRRGVSHGALAARGRRLHRPAGRRDRDGIVGHSGDSVYRRAGPSAVRVPAQRQLQYSRRQRAARR